MLSFVYILFGGLITIATAWFLGTLLLRKISTTLGEIEAQLLAFATGSACLSVIVFALCAAGLARKGIFLAAGLLVNVFAIGYRLRHPGGESASPGPQAWIRGFLLACGAFTVMGAVRSGALELISASTIHRLSLVDRAHGFNGAYLSDGVELLFLYAFAFGRQSAAALVNISFLVSVTVLMLCYGRRIRYPVAGAAGAILTGLSLLFAFREWRTSSDMGTALLLFALFYMLQIWVGQRESGWLGPIGILALALIVPWMIFPRQILVVPLASIALGLALSNLPRLLAVTRTAAHNMIHSPAVEPHYTRLVKAPWY